MHIPEQDRYSASRQVTILGEIPAALTGTLDAHSQIWIEPFQGAPRVARFWMILNVSWLNCRMKTG